MTSAGSGRAWKLFGTLTAMWIPGIVGAPVVGALASRWALAESPHPYWLPGHAWELYGWAPLVIVSVFVQFLSPGLLLAAAWRPLRGSAEWLVYGSVWSLLLVPAVVHSVEAAGPELRGAGVSAALAVLSLLCFAILLTRVRRGAVSCEWLRPLPTLVTFALPALVVLAILAPKVHWESFNGDGAHAFEAIRLLLHQPVPFFPADATGVRTWPGTSSMAFAFPGAVFMRVFGEVEAAVRAPFALYLVLAAAGVFALAAHGRRVPAPIERALVWLALAVFTLAMAYSATYSPYLSDLALPGVQDTLFIACFLGFCVASLDGRTWHAAAWLILTLTGLPTGLLLVGLWILAAAAFRLLPMRRLCWIGLIAIAVSLAMAAVPSVLAGGGLPLPGGEYGGNELINRFRFLQATDVRRLGYLAIPAGIAPVVSLALWRRQDQVARAFAAVAVIYFGIFYIQAFVSLHHFVPVMILPLVVLWRLEWPRAGTRRAVLLTTAVLGVTSLVAALPADVGPHTFHRRVGLEIRDEMAEEPGSGAGFARAEMLAAILPATWDHRVPDSTYGGSPLVWKQYADRAGSEADHAYLIRPASAVPPDGARRIAEASGAALYVLNAATLDEHLAFRPPASIGSPWLRVSRGTLFRGHPNPDGPRVFDMRRILRRIGGRAEPRVGGAETESDR